MNRIPQARYRLFEKSVQRSSVSCLTFLMKEFIGKYYGLALLCSLPIFMVYVWSDQLVNGRYTAKTFYFYFCSALIFIVLSVIAFFKKSRVRIKITKLDLALLIFYLYNFIRILFTPDKPVYNTRFICYSLLIGLYFIWKYLFEIKSENRFGVTPGKILLTALLITGAGQAVWGLMQIYNIIPVLPNIGGFRVFGNFGNPSPYASFLASFLPMGLGFYLLIKSEKIIDRILKNLGIITFVLCVLVLPATYSRSSWLGALGGSIIILAYKCNWVEYLHKVLNKYWKKVVFIILLTAIVVTGIKYLYCLKKDSAIGRLIQWKISVKMVMDKPVFGMGFDTFGLHYNSYQADYFAASNGTEKEKIIAGYNQQAHNEYLEIAVELGIIGIILFFNVMRILYLKYLSIYREKNQSTIIIVFSGIFSFLIMSCFTFPLQILPSLMIFCFLISAISAMSEEHTLFKINSLLKNILSTTLCLVFAVFLKLQYQNYIIHRMWQQANKLSSIGKYKMSQQIYTKIYPKLKTNGNFLLNYGGTLALNNLFDEAIPILKESEKYISDPNLFLSLGNCYKETENCKDSEKYYLKASNITPHQMYPKYLLLKLYDELNKKEKVLLTSKEILKMKIKINSTAVTQMKRETDKILKKNEN